MQGWAEAGRGREARVSEVMRLAWAHLGFHGRPFPVADPFLEAGQERRFGWPHVRNLVPLAHSCSREEEVLGSPGVGTLATAPTRDVTTSPSPGQRPGNMAASLLASTSDPSAKFKFAAILRVRNPGSPRGWRCGYPLCWSWDPGLRAPWRPAAKVSKESQLRDPVPAPKYSREGQSSLPRVPGRA